MLILAPMQGLTELLFRRVYHQLYPGAFDYAVSPFLSLTHGNLSDAMKKIDDVLPTLNKGSMPVVPQILGNEPREFVELANRLYDLGYGEVNWNMGCPMRRVAGKHRGSGLLPYPDEVRQILDSVVPNIKPMLSVKVRLGYRSSDEIERIIPVLNSYPLKNITVHPRIGKQMYSGVPSLDKLEELLPSIKHEVIYNGDICTVGDFGRIRQRFPGIKDVMIGRGVLYNPLLPLQIRESLGDTTGTESVPNANQFVVSLTDAIMMMAVSDEAKGRKMKEYWCLLSKSLPGTEQAKRRVLHASRLDEIKSLILEMAK